MQPGCSLATLKATLAEKGARAGPASAAVVKVFTIGAWLVLKMVMLTFASNTRARPETRIGLVTRDDGVGTSTTIDGSAGFVGLGFGGHAALAG
jgi:hypothetical protein